MKVLKDYQLPNGNPLEATIINLLCTDLFGILKCNGSIGHWYSLMRTLADADNTVWESEASIDMKSKKKDPLLVCHKSEFSTPSDMEWTKLFDYVKFGHDAPLWVSHEENLSDLFSPDVKRVMIVSQDPLRNRGAKGTLLLSSPFGMHCREYREKQNITKIIKEIWEKDTKVVFYLTDYNKFYVQDSTSIKLINQSAPNMAKKFMDILDKEIALFNPHLIVTIGDRSSEKLVQGFKADQRFKLQTYKTVNKSYNVLPMYHIANGRVAITRMQKFDAVNNERSGKYRGKWFAWYADEICHHLQH